jgi:hypothetical protein
MPGVQEVIVVASRTPRGNFVGDQSMGGRNVQSGEIQRPGRYASDCCPVSCAVVAGKLFGELLVEHGLQRAVVNPDRVDRTFEAQRRLTRAAADVTDPHRRP